MTIWLVAMAVAGISLGAAAFGFMVQQPPYVVRSLILLGLVFGFAFGSSFPAVLNAYREAELRKTIAADL